MRRNLITLGFAAALLVAPGTVLAAPPFGLIDKAPTGIPGAGGILGVTGWALDDDGVAAVDIYVDGAIAGRAFYGFSRPDVEAVFPGFPDSATGGWAFNLDTSRYPNGLHSVAALATSVVGERIFLDSAVYEFLNTTANLVPFGRIDFPLANTELFGNCDLAGPPRFSVINGFAVDAGIEIGDTGVGYVELLIDGSLWANSRVDCEFDFARGGLSDCYGLRRIDIERSYPTLRDAPHSGFRFVIDVGFLINFGYSPGFHVLSIRSGDVKGQVAEIAELPVTFFCDDFIGNEGSFGDLDLPPILEGLLSGVVHFTGWALDWEGVADVRIFVDGEDFGSADRGLPRPGVSAQFPGYPDSAAPGWSFNLDSTRLPDGPHNLQVIVRDQSAAAVETLIGERAFTVVNSP